MPHLNRDQRLSVFVLQRENLTMVQITERIGRCKRQVRDALAAGHPTPKNKTGRKPVLNEAQVEELVQLLCSEDEVQNAFP